MSAPVVIPPLVKSMTGSYTLGFVLLAAVAVGCLLVLFAIDRFYSAPDAPATVRPSRPAIAQP
jgi:hypothetical protein